MELIGQKMIYLIYYDQGVAHLKKSATWGNIRQGIMERTCLDYLNYIYMVLCFQTRVHHDPG